ncbi:IclR family transcriptional regulator [Gallaecimonas pentaromativorans]|uniref:HTH-type transcriptional repressor AllR n=1 Tax=Gallaecimonas pentaromativorans TaxID=584787 RepID=A0A3N1NZF6_9GAMM|nr:IclR family transcriptional regulator [Gallaecimonas pentaromativorans]
MGRSRVLQGGDENATINRLFWHAGNPLTTKRDKGSAISRVLEIIELVSNAEAPLSPADIAHGLDIPKPSVHRLLAQLKQDGFLQMNLRGLWEPGNRLYQLSMGVWHADRFKTSRQAIMQRLADAVQETCGISIPNGLEMVYYDRVQANWPLQIYLPEGSHTPVWCTSSGKLYLASLSKAKRQTVLASLPIKAMTRNTITDLDALNAELDRIAKTGIGTDDEEFIDGMVACSVPIKDGRGKLVACLYVHAPKLRLSLDGLLAFAPQLRQAAADLSRLDDTEI